MYAAERRHDRAERTVGLAGHGRYRVDARYRLDCVDRQCGRYRLRCLSERDAGRFAGADKLQLQRAELRDELHDRRRRLRCGREPLRSGAAGRLDEPVPGCDRPERTDQSDRDRHDRDKCLLILELLARQRRRQRLRPVPERQQGRLERQQQLHLQRPHLQHRLHRRGPGLRRRRQPLRTNHRHCDDGGLLRFAVTERSDGIGRWQS